MGGWRFAPCRRLPNRWWPIDGRGEAIEIDLWSDYALVSAIANSCIFPRRLEAHHGDDTGIAWVSMVSTFTSANFRFLVTLLWVILRTASCSPFLQWPWAHFYPRLPKTLHQKRNRSQITILTSMRQFLSRKRSCRTCFGIEVISLHNVSYYYTSVSQQKNALRRSGKRYLNRLSDDNR